jgi:hypothetical protein
VRQFRQLVRPLCYLPLRPLSTPQTVRMLIRVFTIWFSRLVQPDFSSESDHNCRSKIIVRHRLCRTVGVEAPGTVSLDMFTPGMYGQTVEYDRIASITANAPRLRRVMFVEVQTCATDVARQPVRPRHDPQWAFLGRLVSEINSDIAPMVTRIPVVFSILACWIKIAMQALPLVATQRVHEHPFEEFDFAIEVSSGLQTKPNNA